MLISSQGSALPKGLPQGKEAAIPKGDSKLSRAKVNVFPSLLHEAVGSADVGQSADCWKWLQPTSSRLILPWCILSKATRNLVFGINIIS